MEDNSIKKLKELLPYIIITGVLFLLLPLFMGEKTGAATYIIELGAFPLTALCCGFVYKLKKKENSIYLCLTAPLFYMITALLYGMWRQWFTVLIYTVAYFVCSFLGLMLADIVPIGKKSGSGSRPEKKISLRPRRVNVAQEAAVTEDFVAQDPDIDDSLDVSTTDDDIEAILNNIHNRKSQ